MSTDPVYNALYVIINHGQYKFESIMSNHSLSDLEWLKCNLYYIWTLKINLTRRERKYK